MSDLKVRTDDHPEANGRKPQPGEFLWSFRFKLEDGSTLIVEAGPATHDAFRHMLLREIADDELDAAIAADTIESDGPKVKR